MKNLDLIGEELFNKIRGRFPSVTIGNQEGVVTNVPSEARFFDFDFKEGDNNLGKVSVSVDDQSLSVMYSNNFVEGQDAFTREKWYGFLKELRYFAKKRLLNFDTRDITKSNLNRRDYKFLANNTGDTTMSESKMYGTSKTSYQDVGSARLALRHSKPVNQELAHGRTQHVEAIYIESDQGERFKYPYRHLNGARAMARHVAEGGNAYDDFGKYIVSLSEELNKLRKFKNYMGRSSVMAEGLQGYMDVVYERIDTVKKTVEQLQRSAYYKEAFENFEVTTLEEVPEDVSSNWIDQLTIKQFNEELKDVFPYIYKLVNEKTKASELGPEDLLGEFNIGDKVRGALGINQVRPNDFVKRSIEISDRYSDLVKNGTVSNAEEASKQLHELYMELINMSREIQKAGGGNKTMVNAQQQLKVIKAAARGEESAASKLITAAQSEPKFIVDFVKQDVQSIGESTVDEGPIDWLKDKYADFKQGREDSMKDYKQDLHILKTVLSHGGMDDSTIRRIEDGCLNDPRVCLYNTIRKNGIPAGDMDMEVQRIGDDLNSGWTTRAGTTDEAVDDFDTFESWADEVVESGVVSEMHDDPKYKAWLKIYKKSPDAAEAVPNHSEFLKYYQSTQDDKKDTKEGMEDEGPSIPVTEFVLSLFDREKGTFPKGETAVLTAIEKDYGEQYINPAKQFIERIMSTYERYAAPKQDDIVLDAEPEGTVMEPTVGQEEAKELEDMKRMAGISI